MASSRKLKRMVRQLRQVLNEAKVTEALARREGDPNVSRPLKYGIESLTDAANYFEDAEFAARRSSGGKATRVRRTTRGMRHRR